MLIEFDKMRDIPALKRIVSNPARMPNYRSTRY
jgi:hypothetical protein